jgi:short subunit dehydrogenase-like uncharacterized protein
MMSRSCIRAYANAITEALQQSGPIAVYGATGYTGRLVAAELRRRGAELVLSGRNEAKLEIVAEDLGGGMPHQAAPLDDPAALRALLEPCAAVIACAGPFTAHGEPVLAAAVDTGTHYLDTTGEQNFMRTVFDDHGEPAAAAGVALVPAMGVDYVPGDMIAALTAEGMGAVDEVVLAYSVAGIVPTRGTMLSALGMLEGGDLEWRGGELTPASRITGRGTFEFPDPVGRQRMIRYPSGEHLTVPRHVETDDVRTMLTASTVMPRFTIKATAPIALPAFQVVARAPVVGRGLKALVGRLPEGPSPEARRRQRFMVVCEVRAGDRRRRGTVRGSDVYGLTAVTTTEGALRCATPGYDRVGALAPSEAFEPRDFLRSLRRAGLEYEVVPLPPE